MGDRNRIIGWFLPVLCHVLLTGQLALAQEDVNSELQTLRRAFQDPSATYTQMPFWFWNGDIREERLKAQIADMEAHDVNGFVIHGRMGLSEEIGYMTPRWLSLVETAVEEAHRRGMMVYLYDEGMYPSGSGHGDVVRGRPDLAAQGLRMITRRIRGPQTLQLGIPLENGEKLVTVVQMQWGEVQQKYLAHTARVVSGSDARIPSGEWGLFIFVQTPTEGVIRGVHWDEEDNADNAPKAADLLNPAATERFIESTHEKYYDQVGQYFGDTIVGMFTDEPSLLGRRAKRGVQPWTSGLERYASEHLGYDFRVALPFLFGLKAMDGREETAQSDFAEVLQTRLGESYYKPLSEWCRLHGIALTGHPAEAGDMESLKYFQHPGQDVVWRWVLPGTSALEGEQSTSAIAAASAAAHFDRSTVINEVYGAYGWRLTMDEMKWLADWLFVRGTTRLAPHAFYYSDAPPRLYERPPDLSWYNLWWEHYGAFARYTNRLSWLMSDSEPQAEVAILASPGNTPWKAAKTLLENQIGFHYLPVGRLEKVEKGNIGRASYSLIIVDGDRPVTVSQAKELRRLLDDGCTLIYFDAELLPQTLRPGAGESRQILHQIAGHRNAHRARSEAEMIRRVRELVEEDVHVTASADGLRIAHIRKRGIDVFLLTNEGEGEIATSLVFDREDLPEMWNPETGETGLRSAGRVIGGTAVVPLRLDERASKVLVFGGERQSSLEQGTAKHAFEIELPSIGWRISSESGRSQSELLGSWTRIPGMESYSGTVRYEAHVDVPSEYVRRAENISIDCGEADAFVQVNINGYDAGVRLWRPFELDVTGILRPGRNVVEISVTNTRANELTDDVLSSGLYGPVKLVFEWEGLENE